MSEPHGALLNEESVVVVSVAHLTHNQLYQWPGKEMGIRFFCDQFVLTLYVALIYYEEFQEDFLKKHPGWYKDRMLEVLQRVTFDKQSKPGWYIDMPFDESCFVTHTYQGIHVVSRFSGNVTRGVVD